MQFWRNNWPKSNIGPKLYMLEDHVVNFIRRWGVCIGLYSEQGGEGIHHEFNKMKSRYDNIKNPVDRLRYIMSQHLLTACPDAQSIKPMQKKRKKNEE